MCGRFVLFTTGEALLAKVGGLPGVREVHAPAGTPGPRYNLAPTQPVPIIRVAESRAVARLDPARWGLLPGWKQEESGPPLFNARGETVAEKPSFREAFRKRRCLIPLDGYYEWHRGEGQKKKIPYYVTLGEGQLLWAAGLWDAGLNQLSTTMITTDSAGPVAWLHHRLPRFLAEGEIAQWLTGTPEQAQTLLHPAPEQLLGELRWRPAAPEVGNVRHDHPGLLDAGSGGLF
ncbi:MAG TPA: SOS response-associated peptidase [Corynebacterium sp.]|nr:SOS response-associated peptidase [Corynebacterium sp.]